MMRLTCVFVLLIFIFCPSCKGQNKTDQSKTVIKSETKNANTYNGPNSIVRNIIQDRNGNIWITSWDGMFRYDARLNDQVGQGKSFTNITSGVSTARFFSVLEDRKGNLWFGTIGSGVYSYDASLNDGVGQGKGFLNLTTKEGLVNNEIGWIYEDKAGNIWFCANGGASRYDGKSVRNYMMNGDSMAEDRTGKTFPDFTRPPNEVTSIIEDKTGKFWFATRGNTFLYDNKKFTIVIRDGKPFTNVRSIIEDTNGNIWLGGNDGLWRYDGRTFTNISQSFVGFIYQDKKGNIWTSSAGPANNPNSILYRYDANSLFNSKPTVTELKPGLGALFGIFEASDGRIWLGTGNGVYRYDGITFERP